MSHFTDLVIGDDVEKQLQPYHEYECTGIKDEYVVFVEADESMEELQKEYEETSTARGYDSFDKFLEDYYGYIQNDEGKWGRMTNPNRKWDWWVVGGRWTGFFQLKDGANGELGKPRLMTPTAERGTADSALKKDIDFESMRAEAVLRAAEEWDVVNSIIGHLPEHVKWEDALIMHTDAKGSVDINTARTFYNNQERVAVLRKAAMDRNSILGIFPEPDDYTVDRETYIENARNSAISTFAIVKDSQWQEKGEMGWFGMSSNEMDDNEWARQFNAVLDELPEDTLLTVVDCHI